RRAELPRRQHALRRRPRLRAGPRRRAQRHRGHDRAAPAGDPRSGLRPRVRHLPPRWRRWRVVAPAYPRSHAMNRPAFTPAFPAPSTLPFPPAPPATAAQEATLDRVAVTGSRIDAAAGTRRQMLAAPAAARREIMPPPRPWPPADPANREEYADIDDNPVRRAS